MTDQPATEIVNHTDRVGPTCLICRRIHPSNAARAVGLFRPGGPLGYVANTPGAELRPTRAEAVADWCEARR